MYELDCMLTIKYITILCHRILKNGLDGFEPHCVLKINCIKF